MLNKLQKQVFSTVGASLAASLEFLTHFGYVASLRQTGIIGIYCFDKCLSDLPELVKLFNSCCKLPTILIGCMLFLSKFVDVKRMSISTVVFLTQLHSGILCLENAFLWS